MYEGQSRSDDSAIKRKEDDLYSRDYKDAPLIGRLEGREYDVLGDWEEEDPEKAKEKINQYVKRKKSITKNILIVSLVFFIGAMVFTFYRLYTDTGGLSPDDINMSVVGPVSVDAGKEVELQILVENTNPTDLLSAELYIDLPDGTQATMGDQENTARLTKSLGTIGTGELINERFNATFFGEENKEKKIYATLEFRFPGSSATLVKETEHSVLIVSSQVGLNLNMLNEANSGQEIELVAQLDSSTSETLENLVLEMNYPFGFEYTSADPEPMYGESTWVLDPLEPFEGQEIRIRGTITGEEDNTKVFTADLGSQDEQDPRRLGTTFSRVEESIIIKRSFIGLEVLIDRNKAVDEPVIVEATDKIYVSIPWKNNLDTKIIDMGIEARIEHDMVDRSSVEMLNSKGYYNSLEDVIIWDQRTNSELATVLPGAEGVVGFNFSLGSIVKNKQLFEDVEIMITANAKARRLSDVNVPEQTKTPAIGKARVLTSMNLISHSLYNDGPFENTGPVPPKPNEETTYTIRWQITNGTSKVSNAVVKTSLPPYVSWEGVVSPSSESVQYEEVGGEVRWFVGEVPAGTGVTEGPREVAFQVGLIPSVTQVGEAPILITETSLEAVDDFTNSVVGDVESAQTTATQADSEFILDNANVRY